jgi:hypothetical protein
MKSDYVLLGSVLLLAIGLGLLFGYTHGTINFTAGSPVSVTSLQVSIKTTGLAAITGVPLTVLGLLLLIAAAITAIVRQATGSLQQ